MKTTSLVFAFFIVALFSAIKTEKTRELPDMIACTDDFTPVCDTKGNVHGNNCTLNSSGEEYDGSQCYNWMTEVCEPIPEDGCVGLLIVS